MHCSRNSWSGLDQVTERTLWKVEQENSAREITSFANFNKNRPVHRKRPRIDFVSFSVFSSGNYDVVLYACGITNKLSQP